MFVELCELFILVFFFFKQKTAYEMRISDWSSDVCSSDLAIDLPDDVSVLRGKQDWREKPHSIWYHRTTGIWQPVWLECVPETSVAAVTWRTGLPAASVELDFELRGSVADDAWGHVRVSLGGDDVVEGRLSCAGVPTGEREHIGE